MRPWQLAAQIGHGCCTLAFLPGGQEPLSCHDHSEPLSGHHRRNETRGEDLAADRQASLGTKAAASAPNARGRIAPVIGETSAAAETAIYPTMEQPATRSHVG